MKDKESEWNRITCMLAKYAELANIGGNKTEGYGVTKYVPYLKAKPEYGGI
jgi:CRISPR/Cas system CSM-associated protein Csm3 (group 7 of RAMP superfamily)